MWSDAEGWVTFCPTPQYPTTSHETGGGSESGALSGNL